MTEGKTRSGQPMAGWLRVSAAAVGLASWVVGAVAIVTSDNEVGSASLVVVGMVTLIISVAGRLPSRLLVSGNEVVWDEVRDAVDGQIAAATAEEAPDRVDELLLLRARLDRLERTGELPEHPASIYDRDVAAALRRVTPPGSDVVASLQRDTGADFVIRGGEHAVFVETKWLRDDAVPFKGSTLDRVTARLPADAHLVVVTNARHTELAAARLHELIGHRGTVISWRGAEHDSALSQALRTSGPLRGGPHTAA